MSMVKSARKYELVLIVDAKLTNESKEAVRKEVAEAINKHGGKVINSQVWLEKQRLTFQIKKCGEGTYYLINFEGEGDVADKVKTGLRLNEKVLRFIFVRVEPKQPAEPARV